jgi:uncharacterized protein YndB with AHSA1/START domain
MTSAETAIEAVRKTITVSCSLERAFETFTEGIGTWWPLPTHSVDGDRSRGVYFEPGPDGRLVERLASGGEAVWGYVLAWDPPHRLVFSWHPGVDCARTQVHEATEVEVRFTADGEQTRVQLEHRAWERLGERARASRESYDTGWEPVLAKYVQALDQSSMSR